MIDSFAMFSPLSKKPTANLPSYLAASTQRMPLILNALSVAMSAPFLNMLHKFGLLILLKTSSSLKKYNVASPNLFLLSTVYLTSLAFPNSNSFLSPIVVSILISALST